MRRAQTFAFRWAWCLGVVLALGACASTPAAAPGTAPQTQAQQIYAKYGRVLETSLDVYRETLLQAGEAHAKGLLTDEQVGQILVGGRVAEAALKTAQTAVLAYLDGTAPGADVSARFLAGQKALLELLEIARNLGAIE